MRDNRKTQQVILSIATAMLLCATAGGDEAGATAPGKGTGDRQSDQSSEADARKALPLAKVNGVVITVGDVEEAMSGQSPMFRQELANPEKQKELLDRLIKTELMAQEAERRGYKKDPEVIGIEKNKLASLMHRKLVDTAEELTPSDEDLKKYYEAHRDDYHKPEKMRARVILIKDKTEAEALLKEVLKDKPELHAFRKIAKERTEDEETKNKGGDLGFFSRASERTGEDPEVPEPIAEVVFKLKKNGDIHPKLVETDRGFHIVMRTGHRKKMDISFEEAKDRLVVLVKREMRRDAVETGIEELKEKYPTTITEENLKEVVIDLSGNTRDGE